MELADRRRLSVDELRLRRIVLRAVRRGEVVSDPRAAAMAVVAARHVQQQRLWTWSVVVPAAVVTVLAFWIGGFALTWYLLTVLPTIATEPFRARRRKARALSAEAANLALLERG